MRKIHPGFKALAILLGPASLIIGHQKITQVLNMSTYSRDTTAISELTGQPVNTWSAEWQRECEARAILKMSKVHREEFFNSKKDENGKTLECGIVALRGEKAAGDLRALMQQILDVRAQKAWWSTRYAKPPATSRQQQKYGNHDGYGLSCPSKLLQASMGEGIDASAWGLRRDVQHSKCIRSGCTNVASG